MRIGKAPHQYHTNPKEIIVFLAGSIEMGKAENWQEKLTKMLKNTTGLILNPRRDDWDSSWVQSIDNPKFRQQVDWELTAQNDADIIAMYFCPETKSPITLLELGLFAKSGKLIVCCPDGYWRKGNVDIVCDDYQIDQVRNLEDLFHRILYQMNCLSGGDCCLPCCP